MNYGICVCFVSGKKRGPNTPLSGSIKERRKSLLRDREVLS